MADDGEYFSIGSHVSCKTCHNQKIEGEVVAFDHPSKMLILKCFGSSIAGKSSTQDIHMVNLNFVEDVVVTLEASAPAPTLQPLNVEKLNQRARQQTIERQRIISAMAAGVSPEGVTLFMAITKTINEVTWQGKNIVVMNQVTIYPPYRPENCKSRTEGDALNHVRKIVEKHLKDQSMLQSRNPTASAQT